MARAQFDREEVIEKSLDLFWQNGFRASSMQQVVSATGLKPGSIYLAFGNKEGLYREALELYVNMAIVQVSEVLDNASSVGEGICTLFKMSLEESSRADYCSCFLIKTQLELAPEENELYNIASAGLGEVEALFQRYLEREYSPAVSQRRAVSIMLHRFGMKVYGYQQGSTARVREGLQEGLSWLPWDTVQS